MGHQQKKNLPSSDLLVPANRAGPVRPESSSLFLLTSPGHNSNKSELGRFFSANAPFWCNIFRWVYFTENCASCKYFFFNMGYYLIGHRQKKNLPSSDLLLLWPGEVRRKREDDSGRTGPALFAASNKTELGRIFFLPMPHCAIFSSPHSKMFQAFPPRNPMEIRTVM